MKSHFVEHVPQWRPAHLRIDLAGNTRPGFACIHQLENRRGICGGSVWEIQDEVANHGCIVLDPDYCHTHQSWKWCAHNRGCNCDDTGWHAPHAAGWDGESDFYEEDDVSDAALLNGIRPTEQ